MRSYRPGDEHRTEPPADVACWMPLLAALARYHRYEVDGLEHVPRRGPALVVGFHAFGVMDMALLARAIYLRDGRLLRGLTDKLVFCIPGLRDVATRLGIVAGTQRNGETLLRDGALAACMPGGALEWSRPSRLRGTMRWGEHRGYARLAIRAGVPIVPTACPASDRAYYLPFDGWTIGRALQRCLGASRALPLPIAIGLGPLPLPVRLVQFVGTPIVPAEPPEAADDDTAVLRLDTQVRDSIADLLRRGAAPAVSAPAPRAELDRAPSRYAG
jgi:1-acyl-sn-glycerol-3-phosphate acyltransferase